MADFLISYHLSTWEWCAVVICGLCIGMSKTGINGLGTVVVPILAVIFGARSSTGILLPMLCCADLFAVAYYRRSAEWKYVIRLLPWALAGFAIALFVDHRVPDKGFKTLIGICILTGLGVMLWNEYRGKDTAVPSAWWFTALFGVMGGFSTMIGNAAGPIMSVFLLSVRLPKNSFVGTAAWFFMIINYLKLPLQYFVWHNISRETLLFDLVMLPAIAVGAWLGVIFVKKVSERNYRMVVYALTLASTLLLFGPSPKSSSPVKRNGLTQQGK
ncbi:MAG: sulfite exporter TauE/SafE family protein [Bacteroidales bacterium]|nr:sulfite exporter TauE/SafE family protein [Bacteroidales bacterium]